MTTTTTNLGLGVLLGAALVGCSDPLSSSGELGGREIPEVLSGYFWTGPDAWAPNIDAIVGVRLRNIEDSCARDTAWLEEGTAIWDGAEQSDDLVDEVEAFTALDEEYLSAETFSAEVLVAVRNAGVDEAVYAQVDGDAFARLFWETDRFDWGAWRVGGDPREGQEDIAWESTSGSVYVEDLATSDHIHGSAGFDMESLQSDAVGDISVGFEVELCAGYRAAALAYDAAFDAAIDRVQQ